MIYLVIVIFILAGLLALEMVLSKQERNKLINAIITKTPEQLVALQSVEKVRPMVHKSPLEQFVAEDSLTEEQLVEQIKRGAI